MGMQTCDTFCSRRKHIDHVTLFIIPHPAAQRVFNRCMRGNAPPCREWNVQTLGSCQTLLWFIMPCNATNRYQHMSYGQNLVHGEETSLSRVGHYRFCSGGTLYKPSWGYRFGYRFRVGPYRFCSNGNPTTLSILLWSYLILSDTRMNNCDQLWTSHNMPCRVPAYIPPYAQKHHIYTCKQLCIYTCVFLVIMAWTSYHAA